MTAAAAEQLLQEVVDAQPDRQAARPQQRHLRVVQPCPNGGKFTLKCKSPSCEVCGPIWAGNQRRIIEEALRHYGGQVVLTDITPPGVDRLPWACTKEHRDRHGNELDHSGVRGCKVERRPARSWCDTYTMRLDALRRAGDSFVRRRICECGHTRRHHERDGRTMGACLCGCTCSKFKGIAPTRLARVHEPQKRGVPHSHPCFGFTTLAERRAARLWLAWARHEEKCSCGRTKRWHDAGGACPVPAEQRSPTFGWSNLKHYDFGYVEGHLKPQAPAEVARYLASYLTGRSAHKPQMRQNIVDPAMTYWSLRDATARGSWEEPKPRRYRVPLVWVSPKLTRLRAGGTGLNMRMLRRTNVLWAVLMDRYRDPNDNPAPTWFYDVREALEAALVFRRQRRIDKDPEVAAAVTGLVFDMIDRFEAIEPGWPKVLQRRECMQFVRALTEIRPPHADRNVPTVEIPVPVAA